jgi:hypothetical protein
MGKSVHGLLLLAILLLLPHCATTDPQSELLGLIPEIRALPEPWVRPGVNARKVMSYRPGRCEHGGGSIYDFSIVYAEKDFAAAVECSRERCEAGDVIGCRDTAVLYLDAARGGPRKPAEGMAFARRGCDAGDGSSCALLAFETMRSDPRVLTTIGERACLANGDNLVLCGLVGRSLMDERQTERAIRVFLQSCRGTLTGPILVKGIDYVRADPLLADPLALGPELNRYEGCHELAMIAQANGDVEKAYDYDRLHCLHGAGGVATCMQIAETAIARYGIGDARTQRILERGCQLLDRTPRQIAVCAYLR